MQTGVQLLTGFLLTLPFQSRFAELTSFDRTVYLISVATAVLSVGLLIMPVMLHRILFRRHARLVMVTGAHRLAMLGTAFLAISMTSVVLLIFDMVAGNTAGWVAAVITGVLLVTMWAVIPTAIRLRSARS